MILTLPGQPYVCAQALQIQQNQNTARTNGKEAVELGLCAMTFPPQLVIRQSKQSTINSISNTWEWARLCCTQTGRMHWLAKMPVNGGPPLRVKQLNRMASLSGARSNCGFHKRNGCITLCIVYKKMEGPIQGFIMFYATKQQKLLVWCSYLSLQ